MRTHVSSSSEDDDPMEAHYNRTHKTGGKLRLNTDNNQSKKIEILPVYSDSEEDVRAVQRHLSRTCGGSKLAEDEMLSEASTSEEDWGPKKYHYYGAESEGAKKRGSKEGVEDAELEERDALRIQREMVEHFDEKDFNNFFQISGAKVSESQNVLVEDFDFSSFSTESARLESLLADVLDPLMNPQLDLLNIDKSAHEFVCSLHRLYTGFQNCFIFARYLMAGKELNSNHEVIKRLKEYYSAIQSLESARVANWEAAKYFLSSGRAQFVSGDGGKPKRVHFAEEVDEGEGKRQITSEMLKNVGQLTSRSRRARTPRTKNRLRYEKGAKKHRSQVAQMRNEAAKYSGEPTGIKKGLIKSTKFK